MSCNRSEAKTEVKKDHLTPAISESLTGSLVIHFLKDRENIALSRVSKKLYKKTTSLVELKQINTHWKPLASILEKIALHPSIAGLQVTDDIAFPTTEFIQKIINYTHHPELKEAQYNRYALKIEMILNHLIKPFLLYFQKITSQNLNDLINIEKFPEPVVLFIQFQEMQKTSGLVLNKELPKHFLDFLNQCKKIRDQAFRVTLENFTNDPDLAKIKLINLINKGVDLQQFLANKDIVDRYYPNNALAHAVYFSTIDLVKFLVEHGANANCYAFNTSALDIAIQQNKNDIANYLVEKGATVTDSEVIRAIIYKNINLLPILFKKLKTQPTIETSFEYWSAAEYSDSKEILSLVNHFLDNNHPPKTSHLFEATKYARSNSFEFFLEKKLDLDVRLYLNRTTCLMIAARQLNVKNVALLIQYGASPAIKDCGNKTALDYAKESCKKRKDNPSKLAFSSIEKILKKSELELKAQEEVKNPTHKKTLWNRLLR